jgi:hypothetical protein
MRERALLLGGSLRVERGVNGIGTSVQACVPLAAPGPAFEGAASGGALAVQALAMVGGNPNPGETRAGSMEPEQLQERLQEQIPEQSGSQPAAQPPAALGGAAPLISAQRPSADGHTRF